MLTQVNSGDFANHANSMLSNAASSVFDGRTALDAGRAVVLGALLFLACSNHSTTESSSVREESMDPAVCGSCHPTHYAEWAASTHAHASDDPLFLAMNRRGQREGGIGEFCVNCHAPMALRTGASSDGLNLPDLPARLNGVTCYFCHSVDAVMDDHDNALRLAGDSVMRGRLAAPRSNSFHRSTYSQLHDRDRLESSTLCGSCHDVVNSGGLRLERTFDEWQHSVFARQGSGVTCGQCHMDQSATLMPASNLPGSVPRRLHSHRFPAVGVPLTPGPETDVSRQQTQSLLNTTLQSALCVRGAGSNAQILVVLDNVAAGHSFPSGATQHRRAWLEVVGYSEGNPIYRAGVVPSDTSLSRADTSDLVWLGDCLFGNNGQQVHMSWEATDSESRLLPTQLTLDPTDPQYYQTHVGFTYPTQGSLPYPDRVTLNVWLAPFDLDVFDDLVATGDLADTAGATVADMRAALAPRQVGEELVWSMAAVTESFSEAGVPMRCVSTGALSARAGRSNYLPRSRCGPSH